MLHVSACSTATSARDDTAHQAKIPGTPHRRFPSVLPVLGRPDPCRRRAFTETPPVSTKAARMNFANPIRAVSIKRPGGVVSTQASTIEGNRPLC